MPNNSPTSGIACPGGFLHGTVYANPFPGYVHGKNPGICPHGCVPSLDAGRGETVQQKLLREAMEFQDLYHGERDSWSDVEFKRRAEIRAEIAETGTYTHTFDELEYGAKVAWRNAPKCANRRFWDTLVVLDKRSVHSAEGMFQACLDHLEIAVGGGVSTVYMTVFPSAKPGTTDGPRIWNTQLIRYEATKNEDGSINGDPDNFLFTEMLKRRFGYEPTGNMFEVLPLVVQPEGKSPEIFHIPKNYQAQVSIWHPQYPAINALGLKWYAIPAISSIDFDIGGIRYTSPPFNGWYADYEVVRDLSDEHRYNMLPNIARALNLDTSKHDTMWRDEALLVLTKAVMHSYQHRQYTMVDHHTLIRGFYDWYNKEMATRGYSPGNWKWLIPPLAGTQSDAYLGLKKMTEYTLKPMCVAALPWCHYEDRWYGELESTETTAFTCDRNAAVCAQCVHKMTVKRNGRSASKIPVHPRVQVVDLSDSALEKTESAASTCDRNAVVRAHKMSVKKIQRSSSKTLAHPRVVPPRVVIISVSHTGNTTRYAKNFAEMLEEICDVKRFVAEDIMNLDVAMRNSDAFLILSSSFGNGDIPPEGKKIEKFLREMSLVGVKYAVLGFGSSKYPRFCGGALKFEEILQLGGAKQIQDVGKCDAVDKEHESYVSWVIVFCLAMEGMCEKKHVSAWQKVRSKMIAANSAKTETVGPALTIRFLSDAETNAIASEQLRTQHLLSTSPFQVESGPWMIATAVESKRLWSKDSDHRATTRVRLDTTEAGSPPYEPGDHVLILPEDTREQSEDTMARFARDAGVDLDQYFAVSCPGEQLDKDRYPVLWHVVGRHTTFRALLKWVIALSTEITRDDCGKLLQYCSSASGRNVLKQLQQNTQSGNSHNVHSTQRVEWANVFQICPGLMGAIPLTDLLTLLPANRARHYSVSSFSTDELHLTVGQKHFVSEDGTVTMGFASNYLTFLQPGSRVRFQLKTASHFHLPVNHLAPIILIAAGTGIAPCRSFWQKRSTLSQNGAVLGPCILFYGCRDEEEICYFKELEAAQNNGSISTCFFCFSRMPGFPKEHVQDSIKSNAHILEPYLKNGRCRIYVSGSTKMASQAEEALGSISPYMRTIVCQGRLHKDAFD